MIANEERIVATILLKNVVLETEKSGLGPFAVDQQNLRVEGVKEAVHQVLGALSSLCGAAPASTMREGMH